MADIEDRLQELRHEVADLQQRQGQAAYQQAAAQERYSVAMGALKTEFGVETIEEARELLTQVEADLAAECTRAEAALTESYQDGSAS